MSGAEVTYTKLPAGLPTPKDDGAADHLLGQEIPKIQLPSTMGGYVNAFSACQRPTVLFIFPRAGSPLAPNPKPKEWDAIPGARGCTPQACSFRDLMKDFNALKVSVFGLSTQSTEVQKEIVQRNKLNYPLLSDQDHFFMNGLTLPSFEFEGERLLKRMSLYVEYGRIKKVFYPVFPPDRAAQQVLTFLRGR